MAKTSIINPELKKKLDDLKQQGRAKLKEAKEKKAQRKKTKPPTIIQTIEKILTTMVKLDYQKIFDNHTPGPITDKEIRSLEFDKLIEKIYQYLTRLSLSHMPNPAMVLLMKLGGDYKVLVGHIGYLSACKPIHDPLKKFGKDIDIMGDQIYKQNAKKTKQAAKQAQSDFNILKNLLEKENINIDINKDVAVKSMRNVKHPLIRLGSLATFAGAGIISKRLIDISDKLDIETPKFHDTLKKQLDFYEKNNVASPSVVHEDLQKTLEGMPHRSTPSVQKPVLKYADRLNINIGELNKCNACKDFLKGGKGFGLLADIKKNIAGLDKAMPAKVMTIPYEEHIEKTRTMIDKADGCPRVARKLKLHIESLLSKIEPSLKPPNQFKRPLFEDSISLMPPFAYMQKLSPAMMNMMQKHSMNLTTMAQKGSITIPTSKIDFSKLSPKMQERMIKLSPKFTGRFKEFSKIPSWCT